MLKSYFKFALRNIIGRGSQSVINIVGLAIGIALFILIMVFVQNELSYDKFNKNLEQIYRLEYKNTSVLSAPIGKEVARQFPEIQKFVRFTFWEDRLIKYKEKIIPLNFVWADKSVFDIFSFSFVKGNPEKSLDRPLSLVLTESTAKLLFGDEDPIGKTVQYHNSSYHYEVTGVIKDIENFHIKINSIASFQILADFFGKEILESYEDGWQYPTYLLLAKNSNIGKLEDKINNYFDGMYIWKEEKPGFRLRGLKEIYFANDVKYGEGYRKQGNLQTIYTLVTIALFILLIACINYINLTTARASYRAKEVGLRKVVGAHRESLIMQFLVESIVISFMAFLLAILLAELFLPVFNNLISGNLKIHYFSSPLLLLWFIVGITLVGILSGIYPAFYISMFQPSAILKGEKTKGGRAFLFRRILVTFQFTISIILIIATLSVFKQLEYMKNKELGFNKENMVYMPLNRYIYRKKDVFKEKLLSHPDILKVSYSCRVPGEIPWQWDVEIDGVKKEISVNAIDPDYFEMMEVKVIKGRNFSWDMKTDKRQKFIMNEEAVKLFGLKLPVGKTVDDTLNGAGQIIGVVKDFHFNSLQTKIEPLMFYWDERPFNHVTINISPHHINETLNIIKKNWDELSPGFPFKYNYLDETFDLQYKSEERLTEIFGYFAVLAIFIASLGLFGLATFIAQQRTKEIGIRKVLGASPSGLILLLSKEFMRWLIVANIIAWPIAFYLMNKWFEDFAYRTSIGLWIFIISAILGFLIAFITVGYQTIKAAHINPVNALKYE
ncbi:MAG: ABC transporter permease [Candidatus Aminicenantes bacterium]|jgi:putative ABC transport system permease protein